MLLSFPHSKTHWWWLSCFKHSFTRRPWHIYHSLPRIHFPHPYIRNSQFPHFLITTYFPCVFFPLFSLIFPTQQHLSPTPLSHVIVFPKKTISKFPLKNKLSWEQSHLQCPQYLAYNRCSRHLCKLYNVTSVSHGSHWTPTNALPYILHLFY